MVSEKGKIRPYVFQYMRGLWVVEWKGKLYPFMVSTFDDSSLAWQAAVGAAQVIQSNGDEFYRGYWPSEFFSKFVTHERVGETA